ncbi:hypothetical protein F5148DRAFT_1282232 [Russula earlei]|uniref:Uncharacterized protein n=1 Tax=Russula earlei TaxID=71964 RepID=A0ACC0UEI1_9AGAM|nr:hypothetical protein F5148DRAFT_1282232 [Russula earlei]
MADVTFRNNSGSNLTLILPGPDGRQDAFAGGNIRTYLDTGKYSVKSGADPIFSFTYERGTLSTDLTGIAVGGGITFNNKSGNPVNVAKPGGEDNLLNDTVLVYNTVGTYTIKDLAGNTVFIFKYAKGTATTTINDI